MDSTVSNYIPYSYLYGASLGTGRVSVPVAASQLPYANFKNVAGSVAQAPAVYSIDKLKILDTLIDRLRSVRADKTTPQAAFDPAMPEPELDALIQGYGRELHSALSSGTLAYAKPQGVVPGLLVSLAA